MKKSDNLFIAALCLLVLAVFFYSGTYPETAKVIRLLITAAGILMLFLAGRAERLEEKEDKRREGTPRRPNPRMEQNYSEQEHAYNRFIILNRVDKLINEITKEKEQPL